MSIDKYLEYINKTNWYKQGGAISPFYVLNAFNGLNEHIGYENDILTQIKEVNYAYFNKDEERKKLLSALSKQEKDKKFIDRWIKDWKKAAQKNLDYLDGAFRKKDVGNWSDSDLVKFLSDQTKLMIRHWSKGVLLEWSDPEGYKILNELLKKYNVSLSAKELSFLIGPDKPTFVQQECLDRYEIVKKAKAGINVDKQIKQHTKKYHWYHNTWFYVYDRDFDYFYSLIKKDIKNFYNFSQEVSEISLHLKTIKNNRSKILRKYKMPSGLKNILYMFGQMTDWRDYRKKMGVCLPNFFLYKIIKRLSLENNLSEDLAKMLIFEDLSGWKISERLKNELSKRWDGSVYVCDKNKKCRWVYEKERQKLVGALTQRLAEKEIKGVVANRGIIKGEVRIIETKEDFSKMKPGDILVAAMTRPEYVPLIKICGGIITDEGGITCHAAVVSRELGKPCIIGTQTATSSLKDGDLVELDANVGIVRKIK